MNKYYVPEIFLRDIRNKPDLFKKLDNKFNKNSYINNLLISTNGFYKYDKNKLFKYKIIEKDTHIRSKFLNKFTLIGINTYNKKVDEVYSTPFETEYISTSIIKYNIGQSKHFLVFEIHKNRIIDFYFLSNKPLQEKNLFFDNDVSSFIEMLMS